jgi:hypothetical protein
MKTKKKDMSTIDEIMAEARDLPVEKQAEVLDFVRFVKERQATGSNELMRAQEKSLEHAWDDEYDEVWDSAETT